MPKNTMMTNYEKNFCNSLKIYVEANKIKNGKTVRGYITRLAKDLGVSQGYLSNIISGTRPGKERWRRFVAEKLGLDYNQMIGLDKEASVQSIKKPENGSKLIVFNGCNGCQIPPERRERYAVCQENLKAIFESNRVDLIGAIDSNLTAFRASIEDRKAMEEMAQREKSLEEKIESLIKPNGTVPP